jgi:hypothetical protein
MHSGDLTGAKQYNEASLKIMRRLVESNPENVQWQLGLSGSLDRMGVFLETTGDMDGAKKHHEESAAIMQLLEKSL